MNSVITETATQDLLRTKIFRPPLPADCVERPDLLRILEDGRTRPLTLVSAPAGYGKSVLISNWLEASDWPAVWISLDDGDSNLQRFLTYLAEALSEQFPHALEMTRSVASSAHFPGSNAATNVLSNELNAIDRPFFLVLDDFHRIESDSPVNDVLRFLLEHPPIPLHVAILTRQDPPLALDRLRGLGQVTEIRMQDLRFDAFETQELLENAAHVRASEDAVANIERELEGWAAGLRLITLALRNAADADGFLRDFRGGTQQMLEYLTSEVISGLPMRLRTWLLRSAFLDRFCAPLCEAVCGAADEAVDTMSGDEFLEEIQRENLFLLPLDGYGRWFRFHHIFQLLLQKEAVRQLGRETILDLHFRASAWLEENGLIEDAIKAALKAGNPDLAAEILERHRLEELENLNWHIVDRWLQVLGPQTADRPGLQLSAAFVAIRRFDVPRLAAILSDVAPVIENNPDLAHLLGELRSVQGILYYRLGDGDTGHALLLEARQRFEGTEKRAIAGFAVTHKTLSLGLRGHVDEALAHNEALEAGMGAVDPIYHCLMLTGRIALSYLSGDLIRSANEAQRLQGIGEAGGVEFTLHQNLFFRIGADLQRGEFEAALDLWDTVVQRRYSMPLRMAFSAMAVLALCNQFLFRGKDASRVTARFLSLAKDHGDAAGLETARACEARIALLQGDLDRAARWAGVEGEPPTFADLFMSVEVPAITRARIWIAQGTQEGLQRAHRLMQETSWRARTWHMTSQVIEADILNSLALAGLGMHDESMDYLAETVIRATPGGWLRPFLEPGKPMADILEKLDDYGHATDYSRYLQNQLQAWLATKAARETARSGTEVELVDGIRETLTNRELAILDLLGNRLQNKEIARALSVSPETVKTHLKNLYGKLGVRSRRDAALMSRTVLAGTPASRRRRART